MDSSYWLYYITFYSQGDDGLQGMAARQSTPADEPRGRSLPTAVFPPRIEPPLGQFCRDHIG